MLAALPPNFHPSGGYDNNGCPFVGNQTFSCEPQQPTPQKLPQVGNNTLLYSILFGVIVMVIANYADSRINLFRKHKRMKRKIDRKLCAIRRFV